MTPQEYFQQHTLDETYIKTYFAIDWTEDKITIPIYGVDSKLLYCRYRHLTGENKFTTDQGSHPTLFAAHLIKSHDEVILCEGELDCMRLWQEGIPAVTGTSGVKTFNRDLVEPLRDKIVTICLDTDEAGKSSVAKYYEALKGIAKEIYVVDLPIEYKDVCEFFSDNHIKQHFIDLPKYKFNEWEVKNCPEEWKLESLSDLMSRELPDEEWLIDRVIPTDGFTFIVGAEATGKSFYTMTIAKAIATQTPWLDHFETKKKTNILFIDKENSPRRKQKRIAGLGIKSDECGANIHWVKYPQYFELADPKEEDGLSAFAKMLSRQVEQLNIGLIIIDSFTDVMVGNENAANDVQAFFDAIRKLFPNKSILVLHHENKPSQGVSRTSSQRVRGSTNITAQIVSGFRVFSIPKTTNEFVLEQFKAGDAEKLKPFKVELVSKQNPYFPDKTYVSEVKYNGEYFDEEGKQELGEELITDFFLETPTASRREIIDHCVSNGISQRTADTVLKSMTDNGQLEKVRNGQSVNYIFK